MENLIAAIQELQASQQMVIVDIKATGASQEEMKTTVRASQEKMEVAVSFVWYRLEETIKNPVEDALASVDQWTQGLLEELNVKVEEMQLGLQTSLDMWTQSLCEEIADTKENLHEEIVDTQKDLHQKLDLRFLETQNDIQASKTLVEIMRCGLRTRLAGVQA
jgi:hypothetical protein